MSKFCGNCGTELQDDVVVCTNCGMNVAPVNYVSEPQNNINDNLTPAEKIASVAKDKTIWFIDKMKNDKKLMSVVLGVAAGFVALIIALVVIFSIGGYNKAIQNYIDATYFGDVDAYVDCVPEEYLDSMLELSGKTKKEFKESFEKAYDSVVGTYKAKYGDDYSVDFKVVDEFELEGDDYDEFLDDLKTLGIAKKSVSEAYEIEVEFTIDGDKKRETVDKDFVAVKIDGTWYLQ